MNFIRRTLKMNLKVFEAESNDGRLVSHKSSKMCYVKINIQLDRSKLLNPEIEKYPEVPDPATPVEGEDERLNLYRKQLDIQCFKDWASDPLKERISNDFSYRYLTSQIQDLMEDITPIELDVHQNESDIEKSMNTFLERMDQTPIEAREDRDNRPSLNKDNISLKRRPSIAKTLRDDDDTSSLKKDRHSMQRNLHITPLIQSSNSGLRLARVASATGPTIDKNRISNHLKFLK